MYYPLEKNSIYFLLLCKFGYCEFCNNYVAFNPIALRTAKSPLSFGCSECNRVNMYNAYVKIALF